MKPLVCVYCEGGDTKLAVITKEKETFKILRAADFDLLQTKTLEAEAISSFSMEGTGELSLLDVDRVATEDRNSVSNESLVNTMLQGIKLSNCEFIPAITEPAIHYHIYEGPKDLGESKLQEAIIEEIQKSKNVIIARDNLDYIELAGGSLLSVFVDGEIHCISMIKSLAQYNGRRYYKIPSVKSAEVSLAYYVAKKKKFFPDDYSLVVYIGKEYSKLVFLQGRKLKHIGTTLDVGTLNLHTYDVYFSKILLEMENGGIPRLDNVVLCGEDDSENLILSFYGTFPEANVSRLEFDDLDLSDLDDASREKMSSFTVPISAAFEYYDELEKQTKGINLLPRYVKEDQKFLQFGWHSYLMLPLLFAVTFYFTLKILENNKQMTELKKHVVELTAIQKSNQELVEKISYLQNKISGFDVTKAILDSASVGAETWSKMTEDMSAFIGTHKNMWLTTISSDGKKNVVVVGYGMNRPVLTEFSDKYNTSLLKNINYEPLRNKKAYKFTLTFDLLNFMDRKNEP